jgi:hypothetical protein
MGNADLKEMQAGTMDRMGEGSTKAGKICGMISVILASIVLLFYCGVIALGMVGAAAGAATGSP